MTTASVIPPYSRSNIACQCRECKGRFFLRAEYYEDFKSFSYTMASPEDEVAPGNAKCEYYQVTLGRDGWAEMFFNPLGKLATEQKRSGAQNRDRRENHEAEMKARFGDNPFAGMKFG